MAERSEASDQPVQQWGRAATHSYDSTKEAAIKVVEYVDENIVGKMFR
jgi:hypothetical protein